MGICFVIQPFDGRDYDRRYKETFAPAILEAGLKPYRVDQDPSVRVPIENIESKIASSAYCLAEITTNNPNIWYELGYAFACRKDVVMVCSDERKDPYPFDVQHRYIIQYNTKHAGGYTDLKEKITTKLLAFKEEHTQNIPKEVSAQSSPISGLQKHEIEVLVCMIGKQFNDKDWIEAAEIQHDMRNAGYSLFATGTAIHALTRLQMIEAVQANSYEDMVYRLTKTGIDWILNNQDNLYHKMIDQNPQVTSTTDEDDLPF